MRKEFRGLALPLALLLWSGGPSAVRADGITQHAAIPLTTTNFDPGSPNLGQQNPLTFNQFDTLSGARALDSVDITLSASTHNEYSMHFVTPGTITATVDSGDPHAPAPTITIFEPDKTTPALVLTAAQDPSLLTRTMSYGAQAGQATPIDFSSSFSPTSPFYLAPSDSHASATGTLTNPVDLAKFMGTGTLMLPVSAAAFGMISVSSGNGSGQVQTTGSADVTVTYNYHKVPAPETIPEPAGLLLWGLAGAGGLALGRHRSRRARA